MVSFPGNRALIIDDHPLFIHGLRQYLENILPGFEVSEAHSAEDALQQLDQGLIPDLIFLDLQLPDLGGLQFLQSLRERSLFVSVLIVSAQQEPAWVYNALQAGAAGYLSKTSPELELSDALEALARGSRYVSTQLRRALDDYRAGFGSRPGGQMKLTKRQLSVLKLIDEGLNNREISARLNISESTVKGHISTLFDIFNVENRTSCIRAARQYGLL